MNELCTLGQWAGGGEFIQLCNPGPFFHYWIHSETTFWNDPPRWPWATLRFPLNLYSTAIAPKPDQQLFHTTSKWHVGAQHLIPPLWSMEGRRWNRNGVRGLKRQEKGAKERGGRWEEEYEYYEYWMLNVISFICMCVHTVKGISVAQRIHKGPSYNCYSNPLTTPRGLCTLTWTDALQWFE